jgi:prostaglandin-E synthase
MANGTTHPPVLWAQRNDTVLLTIVVNDLQNEKYSINEKTLSFYGEDSTQKYSFDLQFFKEVTPQESKHKKTARGLFFVLKKKESGPYWPRLLEDKTRAAFIRTDFNRWKDESDSESGNEFSDQDSNLQAMMQQMGGLGGGAGLSGGQLPGMGGLGGGAGLSGGQLPGMDVS